MIRIGNITFDRAFGPVRTPSVRGEQFRHPGTPHVGIQIVPATGVVFDLQVVRYDDANRLTAIRGAIDAMIGTAVRIEDGNTRYHLAPTRCVFGVLSRKIDEAHVIPHASGVRNGSPFEHSPACKLLVTLNLVAVPANNA